MLAPVFELVEFGLQTICTLAEDAVMPLAFMTSKGKGIVIAV